MYAVLLAVDQNETRAKRSAEMVADLPGTEELDVVLYHVFTDNPSGASAPQVASVHEADRILDDAGIDAEIREGSGDPADEILAEARSDDVDLIALGGRRRSPAGKAVFGSVTQMVILNSDRPVAVAPPEE